MVRGIDRLYRKHWEKFGVRDPQSGMDPRAVAAKKLQEKGFQAQVGLAFGKPSIIFGDFAARSIFSASVMKTPEMSALVKAQEGEIFPNLDLSPHETSLRESDRKKIEAWSLTKRAEKLRKRKGATQLELESARAFEELAREELNGEEPLSQEDIERLVGNVLEKAIYDDP